MKSKPDFYKKTIEKDEDELAESVLTPLDISTNDKKEMTGRKETILALDSAMKTDLINSTIKEFMEDDFLDYFSKNMFPYLFGKRSNSIEEKVNFFLQRISEGAPPYTAYPLLKEINGALEVELTLDLARRLQNPSNWFAKTLRDVMAVNKQKGILQIGDIVRTVWRSNEEVGRLDFSKPEEWGSCYYLKIRNREIILNSKGMIAYFGENAVGVYFPNLDLKASISSYASGHSPPNKIRKNTALYNPSELDVLPMSDKEITQLNDLESKINQRLTQ